MSKIMVEESKDKIWWERKLAKRAKTSFVTKKTKSQHTPVIARYAMNILSMLHEAESATITASSLRELALLLEVPAKYISRAVALLTRTGLVDRDPNEPARLIFHRDRLSRRKNPAQKVRGAISTREKKHLHEADAYRCGHCGEVFSVRDLAVDHLVPVALLGADEPGNWVSLCHRHNSEKSDRFDSSHLKYYRNMPIDGAVGVRYKNGFFWPLINGKIRTETREQWKNQK